MTTNGVTNLLTIEFNIDGRPGFIDARFIASCLDIPLLPPLGAGFRTWEPFTQSAMVSRLSNGSRTTTFIPRHELPSALWFVDHVLRANLYPCQHRVHRRDEFLEALFHMSEGYWFSPSNLIMAACCILSRGCMLRNSSEPILYHCISPGCYLF